jgi:formate dehydrogenase major subunit
VKLQTLERAKMPELSVEERRGSFAQVELGLPEEEARAEARRCLKCGEICYRGYRGKEAKAS